MEVLAGCPFLPICEAEPLRQTPTCVERRSGWKVLGKTIVLYKQGMNSLAWLVAGGMGRLLA